MRGRLSFYFVAAALILTACGGEKEPVRAATSDDLEEVARDSLETDAVALDDAAAEALAWTASEYGLGRRALEEYASDISLAISDLVDYWSVVLPELYGVEHVPPEGIYPYSGDINPPECGGEPVEPNNAFYCWTDDFIAWDDAGLMFPYFVEIGDFAIAFILAHEWGHKIQEEVDAKADFGIAYELQADCYAGAWAWDAEDRGLVEPGDIEESLYALQDAADLKGVPWTDPQAHGTAAERIDAFLLGYEEGPLPCTDFSY